MIYENQIIQGDALEVLRSFPDESVQCCVTSPPYWGLRDYGVPGQLGLEKTPEEYVSKMVDIFSEIKRVLRKDGTVWLNLGDSYCGYKGDNYGATAGNLTAHTPIAGHGADMVGVPQTSGLKPKDLCMMPARVALALQADGWYLRSDIIWSKSNPMPESATDRPTKAHEYIFLLSKAPKYYYCADAIREKGKFDFSGIGVPHFNNSEKNKERIKRKNFNKSMGGGGSSFKDHSGYYKSNGTLICEDTRNKRTVWTVPTQPYSEAHFATFPEKLITPCILAGCPEGGIVLDPFMGSGTTALVARNLNRKYIGIELNPEYIKISERRLQQIRAEI